MQNYRFYGQFDPPVDKVLYERYFQNKINGFYIECGAFDGITESSCYFFEKYLDWKGINIEASNSLYNQLCFYRPNSINLNCALSDYDGKINFTKTYMSGGEFGNGSCKHSQQHIDHLKQFGVTYETQKIDCMTYSSLISKYNILEVDLFVLDVEGFEDTVLSGMISCPILPKVFCIEHTNCGNWETVQNILSSLNYVKDYELYVNSFYVRNI
jgi:FkbM family methyltransferase